LHAAWTAVSPLNILQQLLRPFEITVPHHESGSTSGVPDVGGRTACVIRAHKCLDTGAAEYRLGGFGGETIGKGANADRFRHRTSRRPNSMYMELHNALSWLGQRDATTSA
jgi:hypothetical protein